MKALILTLLLCYSCKKYADVSRQAVEIQIHPVQMEVTHLNDINWRVGNFREEKITQSFTFIVDLPKIRDEDLAYLSEQKEIDSWILRVVANHGSEKQDLGSLYAPFKPKRISRTSQTSAISSVTVKVYYAAAYASERFRGFKCPAFNHNKKIASMAIRGENSEFSLSVDQTSPYQEKSHLVELSPSSFNGGNSLQGEYFIEIAPYDSKRKLIHSSFKRIPQYVSIDREENVKISSCEGVHPEYQ